MNELNQIRNEYRRGELTEASVSPDPFTQFGNWMLHALEAQVPEPTSMTLATASPKGVPSVRTVLLKGFNQQGFVFFTNYLSRKGRQLDDNPHAALVIYWKELERQVRIEGTAVRVPEEESDEYFASRPKESQVSAIISPQSSVVPDRQFLENRMKEYLQREPEIHSRPLHWGGYRVSPHTFEFWQGRSGRLHDRIRYTLAGDHWRIERLAP